MDSDLVRMAGVPAEGELGALMRVATFAVKSGMFGVANEAAAMVIILTGRSLGLDPTAALRGTHVVKGKAVTSSDMIVGIVRKSG